MARKALTLKQRLFIKEYIANKGNATEAAEKVGFKCNSKNSFHVVGCRLLQRVKGRLLDIMEARGIDDFKLTEVLQEGLELPARHPVRIKYLDTAHKLRGDYAPEKKELTGKDGGPIETKDKTDVFEQIEKYKALFGSNGSTKESDSGGNGTSEPVDTPSTDDKAS